MYPIVELFGIKIFSFNICVMLGFIVAVLFFLRHTKNKMTGENQDTLIAIIGADIPFILAGAVLHNKIVYANSIEQFMENLHHNTGIAFLGGLLGGLAGFFVLFKIMMGKREMSIKYAMDCLTPSLILGHAIGRIGCFIGGCCYGKPCDWGVMFQQGSPAYQVYGNTKLFPSQLIESLALLFLFAIILMIKKHKTEYYMISYAILRFILEFERGDNRGKSVLGLSPAQLLCIAIFVTGLIGINKKNIMQMLNIYEEHSKHSI